jgi:hypothetical protein
VILQPDHAVTVLEHVADQLGGGLESERLHAAPPRVAEAALRDTPSRR